ncbi:MAG: hypothetical protein ACFFCS_21235 [Candidatus Hodarchaeota archaeon]
MSSEDATAPRRAGFFNLEPRKSRVRYFFVALIVVLSLRMLENAIHELSHGLMVILSGGWLPENPFLITPFGGYTQWEDVPDQWLPLVNIAGTLFSVIFLISVFVPIYIKSKNRKGVKWMSYWGICILVNALFYWFMSPFIGNADNFDPIGFAHNVGISPVWIVGLVCAIPFGFAVYAMLRATRTINDKVLEDRTHFHVKCLIFYYIISMLFPIVSYMNLLDQFKWW